MINFTRAMELQLFPIMEFVRNMRSDGFFALPPFCRVLPVPVLRMALIRLPPAIKRPRARACPALVWLT